MFEKIKKLNYIKVFSILIALVFLLATPALGS